MLSKDGVINLNELKKKKPAELLKYATDLNIEGTGGMRKQDLIFALLQAHTEASGAVYSEGVLETLPDGFGFLRAQTTITYPAQTISMFRPRRSGV